MSTITPNQSFKDGDLLVSRGEIFALGFFSPGSSGHRYVGIWYNKVPEQSVVWVANRGNPINGSSAVLSIDQSGNLVLRDEILNTSFWSTNVSTPLSRSSSVVQLMDSGNLVLFQDQSKNIMAWQSFDYPCNTLLPQMKLGINLRTGLNKFLTSWRSHEDPWIGVYRFKLELNGSPQFFLFKNSDRLWRTGSWNGVKLSGVPEMTSNFIFNLNYVENDDEVTMSYSIRDPSIFSRLVLNESGALERLTWQEGAHKWIKFWSAPKDQCDYYNPCGAFSDCDPYKLSEFECTCLPGFEPKVKSEWELRDGLNGCTRKKDEKICGNGEGFTKLTPVKVPDTSNASVNHSMGLKDCEKLCLKNCSCTGYSSSNISSGESGCITWNGDLMDIRQFSNGGQDVYIRVSAAVLAELSKHSKGLQGKKLAIILIASVAGLLLLLFGSWLVLKNRKGSSKKKEMDESVTSADLTVFDLKTIVSATDNFSSTKKLGEGGFGSVYKGQLHGGQEIAVKRLSKDSGQGAEEFKNEVSLIARLQHRNLVRLFGCCIQQDEKMLVYEYLPNKGLDNFIFDEAKGSLMDWRKRFEIMLGVARGMVYLHRDSRLKIIHRDLKASNVLLDAAMEPKISDFGMARIFGAGQMEANTNRVVGTYGYMSPEYAMQGLFSDKSDVFSFGVLLLEIISGKKNNSYYDDDSVNLIGHVWELWRQGNSLDIVDPLLGDSYQENEATRCIHIGLLCVQEHANDRPTMAEVLSMLCNETTVSAASPSQPAYVIRKGKNYQSSSSASVGAVSVNDVTITTVHAR